MKFETVDIATKASVDKRIYTPGSNRSLAGSVGVSGRP